MQVARVEQRRSRQHCADEQRQCDEEAWSPGMRSAQLGRGAQSVPVIDRLRSRPAARSSAGRNLRPARRAASAPPPATAAAPGESDDNRGEERARRSFVARLMDRAGAPLLALPRFEAAVGLVDDVGAAAAANDTAVPVARLQRLQRIANLHGRAPASCSRVLLLGMVQRTGGSPRERRSCEVKASAVGSATPMAPTMRLYRCSAMAADILLFLVGLALAPDDPARRV